MPAGESEFNYVYWTTIQLLGKLSTFYSTALKGLPRGVDLSMGEMEDTLEQFYEDGTLAGFLKEPSKVEEYYATLKGRAGQLYQKLKDDTKNALDGIAIVYAHGILDESVYGYLEVISLTSPDSFKSFIEKRQVCLTDIESKTYDQIYKEKLKEYMEKVVEKSSLIFKLDKIHEIVKPANRRLNKKIIYDRNKIEQFDTTRHNIVHGNEWSSHPIDFTQELLYWNLLNFYLMRLVSEKTGLKLSQEELTKVPLR